MSSKCVTIAARLVTIMAIGTIGQDIGTDIAATGIIVTAIAATVMDGGIHSQRSVQVR